MRLSVTTRDLLIASWPTDAESVARVLPRGLGPAEVDGEHLISIVSFRYVRGRLGRLPVPRFSQLNVRVYTTWAGEPAVCFLDARVTLAGMGGALLGAPYRSTRLSLREGRVRATSLGVDIGYSVDGPADPGALGSHELGLFPAGRELRGFRIERGAAEWRSAKPLERPRVDPLLALGFDVAEPASLFYAPTASFEADVPPRRL